MAEENVVNEQKAPTTALSGFTRAENPGTRTEGMDARAERSARGVTALSPTAGTGTSTRTELQSLREQKVDPVRDSMHYREDFGTTLSDTNYTGAIDQKNIFDTYIKDANTAMTAETASIATDTITVAEEFDAAMRNLNEQKDDAYGQLSSVSVEGAYSDWQSGWTSIDVYSSASGSTPESTIKVPSEVSADFLGAVGEKGTGYESSGNTVYVGDRGQELYDAAGEINAAASSQFYNSAGPQVAAANAQINAAKASIDAQFDAAVGDLNTQRAAADNTLAERRGTLAGVQETVALQIDDRNNQLTEIRQSYSDRLSIIDKAISGSTAAGSVDRVPSRS